MMDKALVSRIEKLLDYPQDIAQAEISKRMAELEVCFRALYPNLPEFTLQEKAIFVQLLTKSNDLMKRSMENLMKQFNLTPEKLKTVEAHARGSKEADDKAYIATLESLKAQADALGTVIARINTKYSDQSSPSQKGPSAAEQKRVKRTGWYKP